MFHSRRFLLGIGIVVGLVLGILSMFIRSPHQTYPDGVARRPNLSGGSCSYSAPSPGSDCSVVHSIDYGLPVYSRTVQDGIYYPDTFPGSYNYFPGIVANILFYVGLVLAILFAWLRVLKSFKPGW
jgi:hypothetical protein